MSHLGYSKTHQWWQGFLGYLEKRFPLGRDSLRAWRERIFFAIFFCSMAVGLVPLYSAVKMSIDNQLWINLAAYVGFYLWAAAILLVRRLSFPFRAWNGVLIYFAMGTTALLTLGPASSGRAWFFGAAVLASLLLGMRAGLLTLAATAGAMFAVGSLLTEGYITWPLLSFYSVETWYSTATTLMFLCTMVTVSLAVLVAGLERALSRERSAAARLAETSAALAQEVESRKSAQDELARYQSNLEKLVDQRTKELAASNRDLSEQIAGRKRTELALNASEDRYRQLVQHAPAGIFEVELLEDRFLSVNEHMCRFTGYGMEEFLSLPPLELFAPGSRDAYRFYRAGLLGGEKIPESAEFQVRSKQGKQLWLLLNTNLDLRAGRPARARVVAHDITERKKAEEALLHLASGVSHNFNNALMAIITNSQNAQTLLEGGQPRLEEAARLIDNVLTSAHLGQDVVRRLSRYVSGQGKITTSGEVVDLSQLLLDLAPRLKGALPALENGLVSLELSLEEGLYAKGSRGEFEEVVANLVKNAVEAMPEGGVVRLTGRRVVRTVRLEVADSGPGLSGQIMGNLFQPFTSSKGDIGMGLGLAISQGVVRACGGRIGAANRPEGGAAFTVELPLAANRPPAPAKAKPKPQSPPRKILLVEDESLVAVGVEFILKEAGHQVKLARDKKSALACLDQFQPQAVLCDLGLPDGSGWGVVSRVLEWSKERGMPPVPVVVLTGWATGGKLTPPDGTPEPYAILTKPLDRERLLATLAEAMQD